MKPLSTIFFSFMGFLVIFSSLPGAINIRLQSVNTGGYSMALKKFYLRREKLTEKNNLSEEEEEEEEEEEFSLPSPVPEWPKGRGFAKGKMQLGELEVIQITKFQKIWSCIPQNKTIKPATFYKPAEIPEGFSILGHYSQLSTKPLHGFLLAVRETNSVIPAKPGIRFPVDYKLIWNSNPEKIGGLNAYFWEPLAPEGYKSMGILVTIKPDKPSVNETVCLRSDLTEKCEIHNLILNNNGYNSSEKFRVWNTRPSKRGINGLGLPAGTFFCKTGENFEINELNNSPVCLKNVNLDLHLMPNLDQIHALIHNYGPVMFFHPKETFLPSSVSWFFENGATLYKKGESNIDGELINSDGSNLPQNGQNDSQFWIDLPAEKSKNYVKFGNLQSAELYCQIKPNYGGFFTDIAMWVFCPFNGPGMVKIGTVNIPLGKIGQHVGDWEHFTLRINNFNGELWSVYYSQHSGGIWVDSPELEFYSGNKAVVYSSKHGHASFPHSGIYLQGNKGIGVGIRNDAERSDFILDSSKHYKIVSAEYLGDDVAEPHWLNFRRKWGPKVIYSPTREIDRIIGFLPIKLRLRFEGILHYLPNELYREEGPTGPKEKNNWFGDERC